MACAWLGNGQVELAVTTGRGPRVAWWGWTGGSNLMARVPEFVVRGFSFLGGHRLWAAPESFALTYQPDDAPLAVAERPELAGIAFRAPADGQGLVKELVVSVAPDRPQVTMTHVLTNAGLVPLRLAPWALSMLRLGGVMILPQPQGPADPDGLLPGRRLVLWPYSDVTDPRLRLGNRLVLVSTQPRAAEGQPGPKANKLGILNRHGWLAYWLDGTLFAKRFDPQPGAALPDDGCNVECFFDHRFIEMETLGPLTDLAPGEQTRHVETWTLHTGLERPESEAEAETALRQAGFEIDRAGQ